MTIEIFYHELIVMTRVAGDIQSSSRRNSGGCWLVLKPLKNTYTYLGAQSGIFG